MDSYKMVGKKITRQRMEWSLPKKVVVTKITHRRDGRHKNNSQKGWTDEELYGRYKNNSSREWTDGQLICRYQNKEIDGTKKGDGRMKH